MNRALFFIAQIGIACLKVIWLAFWFSVCWVLVTLLFPVYLMKWVSMREKQTHQN